jgi:hypothetical protein
MALHVCSGFVESAAIVRDRKFRPAVADFHRQADGARRGMLYGIVHGFPRGQEEPVPDGAGEHLRWQVGWDVEPHVEACRVEELLGRLHDVGCEPLERVVGRVHGPDDGVDPAHERVSRARPAWRIRRCWRARRHCPS